VLVNNNENTSGKWYGDAGRNGKDTSNSLESFEKKRRRLVLSSAG
jgi:hypothetical protein